MADYELFSRLTQDVHGWNLWRKANPDVVPDFSNLHFHRAVIHEADLSGANLAGANMSFVGLMAANLRSADMRGATLEGADLIGADLTGANLTEVNLHSAALNSAKFDGAILRQAICYKTRFRQVTLSGADLANADLRKADLSNCNLAGANLYEANLHEAVLAGANLSDAGLIETTLRFADLRNANLDRALLTLADLHKADLTGATLRGAVLQATNLNGTKFRQADLTGADLSYARLISADFENATLTDCAIYGISAWDVNLEGAEQNNLRVTRPEAPAVAVDNLEVAQFVYLLINTKKIRDVINTIGQKAILILGRFIPERKKILDAIAEELRQRGYLPIIFDFEKSQERDITETVQVLAGLSLFVIADVTNPKSSPMELQATVPDYMIPFVPIIQDGEQPFAMFVDLQKKYTWVLPLLKYDTQENLLATLDNAIIQPALKKHAELVARKAVELESAHVRDFLPKGNL